MSKSNRKLELWDGYEVEVNEQLLDDFDFQQDLAEAQRLNDLPSFVSMLFAIVGGEKVYDDTRKHIEAEKGYFSQESLMKVVERIGEAFPKAGSRAQRRTWQTTK